MNEAQGVGDEMPPQCERIEMRVGELAQVFNALDPAPFRARDLDPKADEFIVEWSREVAAGRPLGLVVHLSAQQPHAEDVAILKLAVHEYFTSRALSERRRLKRLLRVGRTSLLIGLVFLGAAIALGDVVSGLVGRYAYGEILSESFLIGGWVALWRPLEIFLYDWWPIRAEARLYDRLSTMSVRLVAAPVAADVANRDPHASTEA